MLKQRKEEIVSSLTEELGSVTAMIVADPSGLSVAEMKDLRNRLRPSGAEFRVAKNTLPGDPAAVAKTLSDFGRTSRKLELRGAYLDGEAIGADGVRQLATLPSREQLLTQLVSSMVSPISGLANVLAQLPRSLVVALDQVRQQKEATA